MHPLLGRAARAARVGLPVALLAGVAAPGGSARRRGALGTLLLGVWSTSYLRYRRRGIEATAHEWELLRTATPEAFSRHYNESVPTVEEELSMWSEYHGHRHEMRYRLVGEAARKYAEPGATVLDIGCGSGLVADRLAGMPLHYIGVDFGGHHIESAAKRHWADPDPVLRTSFVRGDGEQLPLQDASVDLVVFTEVIEHLVRPELAVWEIARVLRPGGVLVMTTNNASEMPLRFPLSDPFAFLEKAIGFSHDQVISHRPWVWPQPVDPSLLPPGAPTTWLPHTWHKQAETRRMFAAAGLATVAASTFEFPPPQSKLARRFDKGGQTTRQLVDVLESVCQATPLLNRLGCHLMLVARRTEEPVGTPPPGVWPGPFSEETPR
jgi:2-polyprenyl-3-methyl-5-hydroxy-6-metoxy-1,4-benzoquinol methylase